MWKILNSKYVLDSPYMKVRQEAVQLPDGRIYDQYFVREYKGWVAIFAVTVDGKILLTRQYKHGIRRIVIELPAGSIDESEEPEIAAARELQEETGYVADRLDFVGKYILEPTACDGHVYVYFADGVKPLAQKNVDSKEEIEILKVSLNELNDMMRSGLINVISQLGIIDRVLKIKGLLV